MISLLTVPILCTRTTYDYTNSYPKTASSPISLLYPSVVFGRLLLYLIQFLTARFIIGHITPEAQEGGPIALLKDDDPIVIDAENRTISVLISSVSVLLLIYVCTGIQQYTCIYATAVLLFSAHFSCISFLV